MLSLDEIQRAAPAIDELFSGNRLERIIQPDASRLALVLYGRSSDREEGYAGGKQYLVISCHPAFGRVGLAARAPRAPESPPAFVQLLRARLRGARLRGAQASASDRQLRLVFAARDEDGAERRYALLLSLTGRRANSYLLGDDECVLGAQRPFSKTRPDLSPGALWSDPPVAGGDPSARRATREARFGDLDGSALLEAIETHYGQAQQDSDASDLEHQLENAFRRERKQLDKLRARIETALAEADQAGELARRGELLKSVVSTLTAGQSEARVRDWESDEEVVIPLDPAKSPKQNLQATFKRYQKLVRTLTKAGAQLDVVEERDRDLASLQAELEAAGGAADGLEALASRPAAAALLRRHQRPGSGRGSTVAEQPRSKGPFADLPGPLRPRRYRSSDGLEIWVGRSDAGNDHLSTRLARGKDLFFHVDSSPGSHVVLRTEGRTDPPSESVLEACELAVRFSRQRNATRCDLHVVPIRNVKKPRGAKPGLVYVTGGKTLHLRRDGARLERVLAARIDD